MVRRFTALFAVPICALAIGCGDDLDPLVPDGGGDGDGDNDGGGDGDGDADAPLRDPVINEFVVNITGSDTHEYVEVFGNANVDLSNLTILEIESSQSQDPGRIEVVLPVGSTNDTGHFVTPFQNAIFQNTSQTFLLVEGFTGAMGDDTDADNNGVFDNEPWTAVIDSVAIDDGGGTDVFHSTVVIPPNGSGAIVSGASRIPDGMNTSSPSDWVENDIDGSGLPCTPCMGAQAESGDGNNTPGAPNSVEP